MMPEILGAAELERQRAELLPARTVLSLISAEPGGTPGDGCNPSNRAFDGSYQYCETGPGSDNSGNMSFGPGSQGNTAGQDSQGHHG
jgi:hypothetical protein